MDEIKLALEMNKLVHDECKDVPHDIGLRLLEIVKRNVNEQLRQLHVSGRSEQCLHTERVWTIDPYDQKCFKCVKCGKYGV